LPVRVPEAFGVLGPLDQFGGAAGKFDADERPMTEDIAHPVAELIAHFGDPLVRDAAIGACVAAVFDERDGGVRRGEDVVGHRPIEPIVQHHVRHGRYQSRFGDDNDQREKASQRLKLRSILPEDQCYD
jgi:hypothetical protein